MRGDGITGSPPKGGALRPQKPSVLRNFSGLHAPNAYYPGHGRFKRKP
jgi:hypothetical protein